MLVLTNIIYGIIMLAVTNKRKRSKNGGNMITKSLEEYLKTIYVLKKENGDVRITDIANSMNCTKPSVNKAVNNLKDEGYLNYEAYGEIELTEKGEELAKKILETYDIVYLFLKEVLKIGEEEAEIEAEKIKNYLNDNTINKLVKYVHKVLGLRSLECNYDINKSKCRECVKRKIQEVFDGYITKNREFKRWNNR